MLFENLLILTRIVSTYDDAIKYEIDCIMTKVYVVLLLVVLFGSFISTFVIQLSWWLSGIDWVLDEVTAH